MATQTLTVGTNIALAQGDTTFPAAPAGYSLPTAGSLAASIDATSAPAGNKITIALEIDHHDGEGFGGFASFTIWGGPYTNKRGRHTFTLSTGWPGSANIRVIVTASVAMTIASLVVTLS